jgi:hypothetical protein
LKKHQQNAKQATKATRNLKYPQKQTNKTDKERQTKTKQKQK